MHYFDYVLFLSFTFLGFTCLIEQSSSMLSFRITAGEWDFARKHEQNYHILRVLRVGKPNMTVIKLTNPHQLALQGSLSLFLDVEKNVPA